MAKFEVGDKVKVVKLDCNWVGWCDELKNYIGKTGIIIGFSFGMEARSVQFEDKWYNFPIEWLEPIESCDCNGQVFIVDADCSAELETGKVYNVKDGYLMIEKGHYNPLPFHKMKDLLTWLAGPDRPHIQAIEFKGFADQE